MVFAMPVLKAQALRALRKVGQFEIGFKGNIPSLPWGGVRLGSGLGSGVFYVSIEG